MPVDKEKLQANIERIKAAAANAGAGDVNAYITKKIEEIRQKALEKSRTRTAPAVPIVKETKEDAALHANARAERFRSDADQLMSNIDRGWDYVVLPEQISSKIYDTNSPEDGSGYAYDQDTANHWRLALLRQAANEEKMADEFLSGKRDSGLVNGASCIYTATDNYGEPYRVASNIDFASAPEKYGFLQIPASGVSGGDVVQQVVDSKPVHGMVFDGTYETNDSSGLAGWPLFNYSRGGSDENSIVHSGHFAAPEFMNDEDFTAYRFVGTPADSLRWKQEYEQLNKFGDGGDKIPWWQRATMAAQMAESPAVMTASGMRVDPGMSVSFDRQDEAGVKQLRDNLAAIGGAGLAGLYGSTLFSNPYFMRGLDFFGTVDGLRNLTTDNGIKKTVRLANDGDTFGAIRSGIGDALDLLGIGDAIRFGSRVANKGYRAYHAFNSIVPYDYSGAGAKLKAWTKSMLGEKKYTQPAWKGSKQEEDFLQRVSNVYGERTADFTKRAREDAWAIYLGQKPKNGMYVKNADGTYSYNLDELAKTYKDNPYFADIVKQAKNEKFDSIGATHGGLWEADTRKTGHVGSSLAGGATFYDMTIGDLWDLQPFSRPNDRLISGKIASTLEKKFGSQALRDKAQAFREWMYDNGHWGDYGKKDDVLGSLLKPLDRPLNVYRGGWRRKLVKDTPGYYPEMFTLGDEFAPAGYHFEDVKIPEIADKIIDKVTDNRLTRAIDNKLAPFEVGKVVGGKPFYMRTTFPYTVDYKLTDDVIKPFSTENIVTNVTFGRNVPEGFLDPGYFPEFKTSLIDITPKISDARFTAIKKRSGGPIHIKPENRGKFTALKERTGHSATWFKEHGTPAQVKMATFALNAAKWHGDGGMLEFVRKLKEQKENG